MNLTDLMFLIRCFYALNCKCLEFQVDLVLVPGTGKGGRITKDDLLNYMSSVSSSEPVPQVCQIFHLIVKTL